jgi:hypothetical protein
MTYRVIQKETEQVSALDGPARYAYFIKQVADWDQVWGLYAKDGWASASHEAGAAFPLWPHPEYAKLQAQGQWYDYVPEPIELDVFIGEWLPNMQDDLVQLAVFPVRESQAVIVPASCLKT